MVKRKFPGNLYFENTRKNFKSNLVFLVVLVLESKGDVSREDSQRRFLAQHSVATLLRHCRRPVKLLKFPTVQTDATSLTNDS